MVLMILTYISRPWPDCLNPPNGVCAVIAIKQLILFEIQANHHYMSTQFLARRTITYLSFNIGPSVENYSSSLNIFQTTFNNFITDRLNRCPCSDNAVWLLMILRFHIEISFKWCFTRLFQLELLERTLTRCWYPWREFQCWDHNQCRCSVQPVPP